MRHRYPQLQSQDYRVSFTDGQWIVGKKTPLCYFFSQGVIDYITQSCYFEGLHLLDQIERDDKRYRVHYFFRRFEYSGNLNLRVAIDTQGDFLYEFENF